MDPSYGKVRFQSDNYFRLIGVMEAFNYAKDEALEFVGVYGVTGKSGVVLYYEVLYHDHDLPGHDTVVDMDKMARTWADEFLSNKIPVGEEFKKEVLNEK